MAHANMLAQKSIAHSLLPERWGLLQAHLLQGGVILFNSSPSLAQNMQQLGSVVPISDAAPVFMVRNMAAQFKRTLPTILIESSPQPSGIARSIMTATPTAWINLSEVNTTNIPDSANVIMALEQEDSFLSIMTDTQMDSLKVITENASHILWLAGRHVIGGNNPDSGLVSGFARALMLEQPALRFSTFAIGDATSDADLVAKYTISILDGGGSEAFPEDLEFAQHNGLLHVSRFEYDDVLNKRFQEAMGRETVFRPLKEALPARLKFKVPGVAETVLFEQIGADLVGLNPDYVEIDVLSVVINPQDADHSAGRVHTTDECSATDYSGIVRSVGSSVSELIPGDRVVVMAPGNIKTIQRCPAWACHKMLEHESFENAASLPTNFATAIHALENLARLQQDQTVLIHSGASSLGVAAIQIARAIGAEIFTTVSTAEERHLLRDGFSIASDHIISLHGSSFVTEILSRTEGQGVDVILNTLAGDGLHDTWRLCAPLCSFIDLGRKDINDAGKLEMRQFGKGVTYTAFNLLDIYHSPKHRSRWASLLSTVMDRFRQGKITPIHPIRILGPAEAAQAIQQSSGTVGGTFVLSLQDREVPTQVILSQHRKIFSPTKTYLLVGCLGGLGRSLSKYMMKQGARRFVFLGRSGCDKPDAQRLVEDMVGAGADVQVIRGNVLETRDVEAAIRASKTSIGGVIQAAMGLGVSCRMI